MLNPLKMGSESGDLQNIVCKRSRNETQGLDLERVKGSVGLKFAYLCHWPTCFFGSLG